MLNKFVSEASAFSMARSCCRNNASIVYAVFSWSLAARQPYNKACSLCGSGEDVKLVSNEVWVIVIVSIADGFFGHLPRNFEDKVACGNSPSTTNPLGLFFFGGCGGPILHRGNAKGRKRRIRSSAFPRSHFFSWVNLRLESGARSPSRVERCRWLLYAVIRPDVQRAGRSSALGSLPSMENLVGSTADRLMM